MAKTIRLALEEQSEVYAKVSKINQYLRQELSKIEGAHINSPDAALPFILNIGFSKYNTLEEAKEFIKDCKEIIRDYGLSL